MFPDLWADHPAAAAWVLGTLDRLQFACEQHGVEYVLNYGTLLGCVRHGGFIPWDDDVDLTVSEADAARLPRVLDDLRRARVGVTPFWGGHKLFHPEGQIPGLLHRPWRWPFIDVFVHRTQGHQGPAKFVRPLWLTSEEQLRPLGRRRFEGLLLNVPAQPEAWLDAEYPGWKSFAVSLYYSHRDEGLAPTGNYRATAAQLAPFHHFEATAPPEDRGAPPALHLPREVYAPGEPLGASVRAPLVLDYHAWVGLLSADTPHGTAREADAHDLAFAWLHGRTALNLELCAPQKPGRYELRLFDSDKALGRELDTAAFEVRAPAP